MDKQCHAQPSFAVDMDGDLNQLRFQEELIEFLEATQAAVDAISWKDRSISAVTFKQIVL